MTLNSANKACMTNFPGTLLLLMCTFSGKLLFSLVEPQGRVCGGGRDVESGLAPPVDVVDLSLVDGMVLVSEKQQNYKGNVNVFIVLVCWEGLSLFGSQEIIFFCSNKCVTSNYASITSSTYICCKMIGFVAFNFLYTNYLKHKHNITYYHQI